MRTVEEFLSQLYGLEVKVWAEADQLRLRAPKGVLTPDIQAELKGRKAEILTFLQQAEQAASSSPHVIPSISREEALPLSFAQQRLWFLDQLEGSSIAYNMPSAVRICGSLDPSVLEQAINEVVRRHEILRTTFPAVDGQPVQQIAPTLDIPLNLIDLQSELGTSREPEAEQEEIFQQAVARESQWPFDLAEGPLLRVTLFKFAPQEYRLLSNMHHIISDGWSTGIFIRELTQLYAAYTAEQPSPLPDLSLQYADFAHWQRQWLDGEVLDRQLDYWREHLEGAPPFLDLPTDRPRPRVQTFNGGFEPFELEPDWVTQFQALSQQTGTSLFMIFQAALVTLLFRYSDQTDIVVGVPIANRNRRDIEPLIGFFVNTLALRTDLSDYPTFLELLTQVQQATLGAYAHQDVPFEQVVEDLRPERNLSYTPLFQVMFAWQNAYREPLTLPGLALTPIELERGTAKFDLILSLGEITTKTAAGSQTTITGGFEYNTDLFEAETIRRMIGHFKALLRGILTEPAQSIAELPLLTDRERAQLVGDWNNTQTNYPRELCIHQLFEEQAGRFADQPALIMPAVESSGGEAQQLTYQQLNARANQVAHHLRRRGVQPGQLVGLCAERSLELIVGLLGILKAGGAYLPLEPGYPAERLRFMLEDTQVSVLLTQQALVDQLSDQAAQLICLDADWPAIAAESVENLPNQVSPDYLAYVCYTSGSTGRPKGACIPHRAVVRLVKETYFARLDAAEVFLQFAPVPFDASTLEIWGPLLNGARLVIFPPHLPSLRELGQVLTDYQVTTLWLTSGLFHQMVDDHLEGLRSVRQLLAGGDVLSVPHVQKVFQELDGCQLINGYGPTENTTFTCCHSIGATEKLGQSVPIGRPIANTQVYILDDYLNPVPIGIAGELYIGGDGLAQAYLNRPALTAERFVPNPFNQEAGSRMYKTGDSVRYRPDGTIEFLGRIDNQIKLRGFRVELGEIEAILTRHATVQDTVVIMREDQLASGQRDKRLVAYVVSEADDPETWRQYLRQKLPDYMIPAEFVFLSELPLNPNGKVDRHALPEPAASGLMRVSEILGPRDPVEVQLNQLWSEVLQVEQIGLRDNFFDLGGHSLLAVQLVTHIEQEMTVKISPATLFQHPTIEQLAEAIRQDVADTGWSALVPIQPQGSRPPFFCIGGGLGAVSYLYPLARHLGNDQPFYGLQAAGLDGISTPHTGVEDMARHYIEAIQTVQPQGPYLLGGHSSGGRVAYEMAQQLQKQGQAVTLTAMLDAAPPIPAWKPNVIPQDEAAWLVRIAEILELSGQLNVSLAELHKLENTLRALDPDERLSYLYERLMSTNLLPIVSLNQLRNMVEIFKISWQVDYLPQDVYPTRITLFRAAETLDEDKSKVPEIWHEPTFGWEAFLGETVEVCEVPGNHLTMMTEPHIQVVASQLRARLQQTVIVG